MPKTCRRSEAATFISTLFFSLATFLALCLGAASPVRAQPNPCPNSQVGGICTMTINIFNDDPDHFIYPVLTTGQGAADIWMQAWFSVKKNQLDDNPYPRRNNYRLYINPANGIAPKTGISLTLPLFTQLENSINPKPPACTQPNCTDTFVDWWNGGTVLLYTSPGTTSAPQPPSLTDALARPATVQKVVTVNFAGAVKPSCLGVVSAAPNSPQQPNACETLTIYSDTSDLPKADGDQLLEYTLGAQNVPTLQNQALGIAYALDTSNVDFDVSYVNVAWAPAAMGVFGNNQVGYTGTPQTIDAFTAVLNNFKSAMATMGWPQFYKVYENLNQIQYPPFTYLKFPSPLEVFSRLSGADPPPDLAPLLTEAQWTANPPQLWAPIAALRSNWITYAGTVTATKSSPYYSNTPGLCGGIPEPGAPMSTDWCANMVAMKGILLRNYTNYRTIFSTKCGPGGTPVDITDNLLISHAYGWGPWTESADGIAAHGCAPAVNLLQNTPRYFTTIIVDGKPVPDYTNYLTVKLGFDLLNYSDPTKITNIKYTFNPWVSLIHGAQGLNIPCAYAYSVDDALGNVQAEGQGFIVDVASTVNLQNTGQCSPPINISLGYDPNVNPKFTQYSVCNQNNIKPVNSAFPSFVINSTNPSVCPVYVWDDGYKVNAAGKLIPGTPQLYTFTVGVTPNNFPLYSNPKVAAKWTPADAGPPGSTAAPIVCTGNGSSSPFQQSSAIWCCDKASSSGVFAFSAPEALSAHQAVNYNVITKPAEKCAVLGGNLPVQSGCRVNVQACNMGQ